MITYGVLILCITATAWSFELEANEFGKYEKNYTCNETFDGVMGKAVFNLKNSSFICQWIIEPKNKTGGVNIMLEKLLLDDGDNVTIKQLNSIDVIFGPFHGQADAVILVTGLTELVLELRTSDKVVQRHFAAAYHSQDCSFTIDNDIPTVTQPVYAPNITDSVECTYTYIVKTQPNITFSFSFESFNLSGTSQMSVTGVQGTPQLSGSNLPSDFLSGKDQVAFDIKIDPKVSSDKFILRKHNVYQACSHYIELSGLETILSPPFLKLLDGDVPVECRWHVKNTDSKQALSVKFKTLNLNAFDIVVITDGSRLALPPFIQVSNTTATLDLAREIRTSSSEMIISFNSDSFASNFSADIFVAGDGKYMKGNGTVRAMPSAKGVKDLLFLLEVDDPKVVMLNFTDSSFSPPTALEIYEDFSMQSKKIATLHGNVWYPVISGTSKMMIVAINFTQGQFTAEFNGSVSGCMHMSPGSDDSYILSGNCNSSCAWIIPPIDSKNELILDLQYIALEKDDIVQVLRLDNKTIVANITSNMTHVPKLSLNAEEGAYISVVRGPCPKAEDKIILVARSDYLPACSQDFTLMSSERMQLTSPNYPDTYPLLSTCKSSINRLLDTQWLHLSFSKLDLAINHCIKITEITKNGTSVFSVNGTQMPDDLLYIGNSIVEFNSRNCTMSKDVTSFISKQGFVINITSTDCGKVTNTKSGMFDIGGNKTICIYKIFVQPIEQDKSVNIIRFHMEEDKVKNYKLNVYDGSSLRDEIISNQTGEIWSRTNTLFFVYEWLNVSKPSAKVHITYSTINCNTSMQCDNEICMHPDWKCNGKDDCGDYSDEKNCNSVPLPPTEPPTTKAEGISGVTFGVCIIIFFAMGVGFTMLLPWAIQKFRNRYRRFNDLSVIE